MIQNLDFLVSCGFSPEEIAIAEGVHPHLVYDELNIQPPESVKTPDNRKEILSEEECSGEINILSEIQQSSLNHTSKKILTCLVTERQLKGCNVKVNVNLDTPIFGWQKKNGEWWVTRYSMTMEVIRTTTSSKSFEDAVISIL